MSVILFFGFSFLVLLAGFMVMGLSLHNMWKLSQKTEVPSSQETLNETTTLEKS